LVSHLAAPQQQPWPAALEPTSDVLLVTLFYAATSTSIGGCLAILGGSMGH